MWSLLGFLYFRPRPPSVFIAPLFSLFLSLPYLMFFFLVCFVFFLFFCLRVLDSVCFFGILAPVHSGFVCLLLDSGFPLLFNTNLKKKKEPALPVVSAFGSKMCFWQWAWHVLIFNTTKEGKQIKIKKKKLGQQKNKECKKMGNSREQSKRPKEMKEE